MKEREWLECTDPALILAWLDTWRARNLAFADRCNYKVSDRKLRLFSIALARCDWQCVSFRDRDAYERLERYVDTGDDGDLAGAWSFPLMPAMQSAMTLSRNAARSDPRYLQADAKVQCRILRDMAGNPFRPVLLKAGKLVVGTDRKFVFRDLSGTEWLTDQVKALARDAYENRLADATMDPLTLAAVADLMEENGCCVPRRAARIAVCGRSGGHEWLVRDNSIAGDHKDALHVARTRRDAVRWAEKHCQVRIWDRLRPARERWGAETWRMLGDGFLPHEGHPVLTALRSPGPHYRGFWAIDLLLGKE